MTSNNIIQHVLNTYWTEYLYKLSVYENVPRDYIDGSAGKPFYYCEIVEDLSETRKEDKKLDEFLNNLKECEGKTGNYLFEDQEYGKQAYLMSKKIYAIDLKKQQIDMDF